MITPKQQLFLDWLMTQPNIKMMVDHLGLEPTMSEEYRKSTMVARRVAELLDQFKKASESRPVKRIVLHMDSGPFSLSGPFTPPETIEKYLITLYGPKPWKYPLPFAPF